MGSANYNDGASIAPTFLDELRRFRVSSIYSCCGGAKYVPSIRSISRLAARAYWRDQHEGGLLVHVEHLRERG